MALIIPMARGLSVSESKVGLLMSAYAAAAALTAIPLTVLATRIPRRPLVIATVALLVVSQLILALAPDYDVALGARVLGALAHGVFWSVVAPDRGRARPPRTPRPGDRRGVRGATRSRSSPARRWSPHWGRSPAGGSRSE